MHRLLVSTETLTHDSVSLPRDAARHLKVVRPRPGELIELFDGAGRSRVYRCGVSAAGPLSAAGEAKAFSRPAVRLELFACITKGSRWDWTVEKATELGVARIVPVLSDRCIVRIPREERPAKRDRWRRIAEDAARQSDAKWIPEIAEATGFDEALAIAGGCACIAGALTSPPPPPLLLVAGRMLDAVPAGGSIALFVGPEGDFTQDELAALLKVAAPASFGPSILRAETAAAFGLSVLAALLHGRGDGLA